MLSKTRSSIEVTKPRDNRRLQRRVVGDRDPETDIAVLQIPRAVNLTAVPIGDF